MLQHNTQYFQTAVLASREHDQQGSTQKETSKNTGTSRLRSSCDFCCQSKMRCTGGRPCSNCQNLQSHCTYSLRRRLGRPKGSKNKRTLMQQSNNSNSQSKEKDDTASSHADVVQSTDPGKPIASSKTFFEFESNQDLIETMSTEDNWNLQALFPQTPERLGLSPGLLSPSATGTLFECDNRYEVGAATPSTGDTTWPSPHSSNQMGSGMSISADSSRCLCLQLLVKLLYNLEYLRYSHNSSPALDSVLHGVKLAETPWEALMQCERCQDQNNEKEVFLSFAMSIRILLSSVQKLHANPPRIDMSPNMTVSVGNFELTGEAKTEVISIALRKALQTITTAILHLSRRTGRLSSLSIVDHAHSNSDLQSHLNILTSTSPESQMRFDGGTLVPESLGAEQIVSLLNALQYTLKAMEEELRASLCRGN